MERSSGNSLRLLPRYQTGGCISLIRGSIVCEVARCMKRDMVAGPVSCISHSTRLCKKGGCCSPPRCACACRRFGAGQEEGDGDKDESLQGNATSRCTLVEKAHLVPQWRWSAAFG